MPFVWILIGVALLCSMPSFFIPFLHTDEGVWSTMSGRAFFGDMYSYVLDHKPPFLFQMHWILSAGERSMCVMHFASALWNGFGAVLIYWILRRLSSEKVARTSALTYAMLIGLIDYNAYLPDRALLPAVYLSIWLALRAWDARDLKRTLTQAFFCGLAIGAAACIKQTALCLSAVALLILLRSRFRIWAMSMAVIGALLFTLLSWWMVGSPFSLIWQEAYLANFSMIGVQVHRPSSIFDAKGIVTDFIFVFGICYLPVVIPALAYRPRWRIIKWSEWYAIVFFLAGLFTVGLSGRYAQNYYVVILAPLCIAAASTMVKSRWQNRLAFFLCTAAVLGVGIKNVSYQLLDKNKNYDSQILGVADYVRAFTSPDASIWISHAVPSLYYLSGRASAVSSIVFMHNIGYLDVCRAHPEELNESSATPKYDQTLAELELRAPAAIFWVSRASNTCADRLLLSNFPRLAALVERGYEKIWSNRLGTYYQRRYSK